MNSPRKNKVGEPSLTKFPLRELTKKREDRKLARGCVCIHPRAPTSSFLLGKRQRAGRERLESNVLPAALPLLRAVSLRQLSLRRGEDCKTQDESYCNAEGLLYG